MSDQIEHEDGRQGPVLDPYDDPDRWEVIVTRINHAAGPLLATRRAGSLAFTLSTWRTPVVLGSAGLVAAAALALLFLPKIEPVEEVTLAEAVMPWAVAGWMDGSYTPTVQELVQAVEEYTP